MAGLRLVVLLLAVLALIPARAEDEDAAKILVTFADPGLSNAARAGPPRPGYSRRSSTYLVSVGVRRAANRIARDFDLDVVDEWPIIPLNVHCLVYAVPDDVAVESLLAQLRERPEVESAQRQNRFDAHAPPEPDPYAGLQHNLETLDLEHAHTLSTGNGSSIAIIDTGADIHHPDLEKQIKTIHDFVAGDADFSTEAHGTAIAGVIAAATGNGFGMTGVAPDAELTVLRACWYTDRQSAAVCDSFTLAKALTFALESGTDIINLSLGGPPDPLLGRLVAVAQDRGIVVVAAAPATGQAGFPANVPGVIVVDSLPASNVNGTIMHLLAPGDEILVPVPGGGFDYASGTSLSAAHVSGVIALLLSKRPGLALGEVRTLLAASRMDDSASVNACRALAHLLQQYSCRDGTAASRTH